MTEALPTLESLRSLALREAQQQLVLCERELAAQRIACERFRKQRVAVEAAVALLRSQFAGAAELADLRRLELGLEGAARDVEGARLAEQRAERQVAEAEHRLKDAEARVREHAVARKAVVQVMERERALSERRAERRAEDDADDVYRNSLRP